MFLLSIELLIVVNVIKSLPHLLNLLFSLLSVANKGSLTILTLLNMVAGAPVNIVSFSQCYAIASSLTPLTGGGLPTQILQAGYRNGDIAFHLFKRIWLVSAGVGVVFLGTFFLFPQFPWIILLSFSIVASDCAINLLRSQRRTALASFSIIARLTIGVLLAFVCGIFFGVDSFLVTFSGFSLFAAVALCIVCHFFWKSVKNAGAPQNSFSPRALAIAVMLGLNLLNANFDRIVIISRIAIEDSLIYTETRNILSSFLFVFASYGVYNLDKIMSRETSIRLIQGRILYISAALVPVCLAWSIFYAWSSNQPFLKSIVAAFISWTLISLIGSASLASSWLMAYINDKRLLIIPLMLLVAQGAGFISLELSGKLEVYFLVMFLCFVLFFSFLIPITERTLKWRSSSR